MDRTTARVVLVATALGLALRAWDLTGTSLTHDEAYSVWVVRDGSRFLARLETDGHPPLWYAGLAAWTAVAGAGDLAARLSSALAAVALVPLAALAARRMFDEATARWAAVLAAIWPLLVLQQRETRMYAWLAVLVAAALWLLARARSRDRTVDWVAAGAALAAAAATHHFGAVAAAGLVAGVALDRRAWRGLLVASGVGAALYLPVAAIAFALVEAYPAGASRGIGPGSLLQLAVGLTVGPHQYVEPALLLAAAALIGATVVAGVWRAGAWRAPLAVALAVGTIVPTALAAWVFAFPPAPKYFIGVVPIAVLGAARFAATARRPGAGVHAAVAIALLVAGSVWGIAVERRDDADWRGLATLVDRESTREEIVYVAPAYFRLAFERYYSGRATVRAVPDVTAAPPEFPRPSTDELRAIVAPGAARWVLVPDWLLAEEPEIARALATRAREIATGWWMRAFSLPAR